MKTVSVESALTRINQYLNNDITTPFFVVVDDSEEYADIVDGLGTLAIIHVSEQCADVDVYPDIDLLCSRLSTATQNTILLGLGESTSLSNRTNDVGKIKDILLESKVIVLCREIRAFVNSLCADDNKFDSRRVCFLKSGASYEIMKVPSVLAINAITGFKELLFRLENGASGLICVKTELALHNIREVGSAYEVLRQVEPTFPLPQTCLTDNLWAEFLANHALEDAPLTHWRSFLKVKLESPPNIYLKYVADTSTNCDSYEKRIFCALLDFSPSNQHFGEMYIARKMLLKDFSNSDIAEYIAETIVKDSDRIYYLTDNTAAERQAIIACMDGVLEIPNILKDVYPALDEYLQDYSFSNEKGQLLTDYFSQYKRLKITNRLTPEFHKKVCDLAIDGNRPYNSLNTRGEVLDRIAKRNTALYWVDALGVEYLGYIQSRANALGLKILIHAVRANLPTITTGNHDFYEAWQGIKGQTKDLDTIKHEGEQDFNYVTNQKPIHLEAELCVVDVALDWVKTKLAGKNADKVILVSDHGASRLAVISKQECKWEMASNGEHSGRCCPCSEADVKSEYATKEKGFWVLANYDRFKGGRRASVEVHGGATLEEVVVPIIEITLFNNKIEVSNTTPTTKASYKTNAEIVLFSATVLNQVSVKVDGKRYEAEAVGSNKHKITFHDIKQVRRYIADVFEGDNLIGQVEFEVERESGKAQDDGWF